MWLSTDGPTCTVMLQSFSVGAGHHTKTYTSADVFSLLTLLVP